jgi:RNA polymerase sigma-70 factor (ECF subfamily)
MLNTAAMSDSKSSAAVADGVQAARLQALFSDNYAPVWRLVRRMGLSAEEAADTAQQAFLVTAERFAEIAVGTERAFVFQTAFRLCLGERRHLARVVLGQSGEERVSAEPAADELADLKKAREYLDGILEKMPAESRMVFVMFELEGFKTHELAELLDVPEGTIKSRLRRAREQFQEAAKRFEKVGRHV